MKYKYSYINNTGEDLSIYHTLIMAAIDNDGKFSEDYDDIFILNKTPEGSSAEYSLYFK